MFDGPLEDRIAIRERIEAYGDAVFRRDAEAWIANWSEDGHWLIPALGVDVEGKSRILAGWTQAMASFRLAAFFSTVGSIAVRGAEASARVHAQEVLIAAAGGIRRIVGSYEDTLVKRGGVWLFRRRAYTVHLDQTEEA